MLPSFKTQSKDIILTNSLFPCPFSALKIGMHRDERVRQSQTPDLSTRPVTIC
jgi:hypothetical protein